MLYAAYGNEKESLSQERIQEIVLEILEKLGPSNKVAVVPPDITRFHSQAGFVSGVIGSYYQDRLKAIIPALGTHTPMTESEIAKMYGDLPRNLFRVHKWRTEVDELGRVPGEILAELSDGKLDFTYPVQVSSILNREGFDRIISVGQVVPHEVIGMANHNKNIFVGTGGSEAINKSHYLGAVYGMERIMGRAKTPVRDLLNYGSKEFAKHLPIVYILTVVGREESGELAVKGIFAGDGEECFLKAAELSATVNICFLDKPIQKALVYLDPEEYRSTWLGNKAIYRSRMALADGGELIILAPGLQGFGEDKEIDKLVRKYGYFGTDRTLKAVEENEDLGENLSAAAHLIHGSSEGRFTITYCPGHLSKEEVESVGFRYTGLKDMMEKYRPLELKEGYNSIGNEEVFFISNPATGLWSTRERFI